MTERLKNTIRERRISRNWSMQALADRVGTTVGTINRIETGETKLMHDLVPALGEAFGCAWRDLFAPDDPTEMAVIGFADDAAPFVAANASALSALALGPNRDLWTVQTDALDAIGIAAGRQIVVNISADAVDRAASLDAVVIQLIDPDNPMHAATLLRQYVEPDLFITNSSHANAVPLTKRTSDIRIKGIVENVIMPPRPSRS